MEDLLSLAKSDRAEIIRIQERVDLSFVTMNAVLTFEPVIYDERKNLSYDVQYNLFVMGDKARLQQLVGILLDNAIKYCSEGGQIFSPFLTVIHSNFLHHCSLHSLCKLEPSIGDKNSLLYHMLPNIEIVILQ